MDEEQKTDASVVELEEEHEMREALMGIINSEHAVLYSKSLDASSLHELQICQP